MSQLNICSLFLSIVCSYRSLQSIKYSFLCYTAGSCQLSILYIAVCICSNLPIYPYLPPYLLVTISFFFYIQSFTNSQQGSKQSDIAYQTEREQQLLQFREGNRRMQFSILECSSKGKTNKNTAGKRSSAEGFYIQISL